MTTEISSVRTILSARNVLLAALSPAHAAALAPHFTYVDLPQGFVLVEPDAKAEFLYFLEQGLASTDALSRSGRTVEVGVIGFEGVVGLHVLLGKTKMSHLVIMQGAGSGFRIRAAVARQELAKDPEFLPAFHTFLHQHIMQVSQSVLCNRLHEAEARLSRWLLMASDHMQTDRLVLTQEFISQMLGSTRSTVALTARTLQDAALISYSRGKIRILDRRGLQRLACECYEIVRRQDHDPTPGVAVARTVAAT